MAGVFGLFDAFGEVVSAPVRPVVSVVATEGKVFESAFEEVVCGEVCDGDVVGFDPGEFGYESSGADIDEGDVDIFECVGDGLVFDSCDDAVALPVTKPWGSVVASAVFSEIDGPWAMFAHVAGDTT